MFKINRCLIMIALLCSLASWCPITRAQDFYIPGGEAGQAIRDSHNPRDAEKYLTNPDADVRRAACMRLGDIGDNASLLSLEQVAANKSEDYDAREEAALSHIRITYRLTEASIGGGERVCIELVSAQSSNPLRQVGALRWACEKVGDAGCTAALSALSRLANDPGTDPYLKNIVTENVDKIQFIESIADDTERIERGLVNAKPHIRSWALRALVKSRPADLLERLHTLFEQAKQNDPAFSIEIAAAIDEENERTRYPALTITSPTDGELTKASYVILMGCENGIPFYEYRPLAMGENILLKESVDPDGFAVSSQVTVYRADEPPVIAPIGDKQVPAGMSLSITVSASDPDDTDLVYLVSELPAGAEFNYQTHAFSWTPATDQAGDHTVTFRVDDGWGLSDSKTITITVTAPIC